MQNPSPGFSVVEDEEDCAAGSDSEDFKLPPSPSGNEDESETDSCGRRRAIGKSTGSPPFAWDGSKLGAISFGRQAWIFR